MHKKKRNNSYNLYALHLPIIILVAGVLGLSIFASNKAATSIQEGEIVLGSKSNKGKSNNSNKSNNKPDKSATTNNKPDNSKKDNPGNSNVGSPNSRKYRESIENVVEELNEVAVVEEEVGNDEVAEEIVEIAEDEEETVDEVTEAIESVESKPKWQVILFGSDYKNLGQLRSSLAHNTNSIRKLTRTSGSVQTSTSGSVVNGQLDTLLMERERIKSVIEENENQFSLLGWVVKFLTGYSSDPVDDDDIGDIPSGTEPGGLPTGTGPGDLPSQTEPGGLPSETEPGDTPSGTEPSGTVVSGT